MTSPAEEHLSSSARRPHLEQQLLVWTPELFLKNTQVSPSPLSALSLNFSFFPDDVLLWCVKWSIVLNVSKTTGAKDIWYFSGPFSL